MTPKKPITDIQEHWNHIFKTTPHQQLGWFENDFNQTLKFINEIDNLASKTVFIAGAGTTMLVDQLIGLCFKLILNDISGESLSILQNRLGAAHQNIDWVNSDIATPLPVESNSIDLWIDRAVLHFLTEERQIYGYFENLKNKLKPSGYAIIAEFSKDGAPKCAGLDLHRYSIEELVERCGHSFKLLRHENYNFINPNGDSRPYIYTLFKKVESIQPR